jgi:hypothetical protein
MPNPPRCGYQEPVWGSSEEPCPLKTYCPTGCVSPLACAVGATCTVPASPELVISNNGVLEKRESELLTNETAHEASGFFHYTISLSVKPSGSVNVTVTKEEMDQVYCVQYKDGLLFNGATYVFGPSNWNVSQKVEMDVLRNKTFQGTSVTSFKHEVSSEDPTWQSPFLRPMTISITDDDECTNGAQKVDFEATNGSEFRTIRKCVCTKGHYIIDRDPKYCNSVIECGECPKGMNCTSASNPAGQILEDALILEGWFRLNKSSLDVMKCPQPLTQCLGNATHGDLLCANGHEGPFCMVCQLEADKRYVWSGQKCTLCDGSSRQSLYGGLVCLGLLVVVLTMYLLHTGKGKRLPGKTTSKTGKMEAFFELVQTKYKILITFTQILSKVATLYPVQLPSMFLSFWGHFSVFSFDLSVIPINCITDSNFHDRLVATTVAPLCLCGGMLTLWLVQRQLIMRRQKEGSSSYRASMAKLTSKTLRLSIILLFTVFPMVSTTIFQVDFSNIAPSFSCIFHAC